MERCRSCDYGGEKTWMIFVQRGKGVAHNHCHFSTHSKCTDYRCGLSLTSRLLISARIWWPKVQPPKSKVGLFFTGHCAVVMQPYRRKLKAHIAKMITKVKLLINMEVCTIGLGIFDIFLLYSNKWGVKWKSKVK